MFLSGARFLVRQNYTIEINLLVKIWSLDLSRGHCCASDVLGVTLALYSGHTHRGRALIELDA